MKKTGFIIMVVTFSLILSTYADETNKIAEEFKPNTDKQDDYIIGPGDRLNILTWEEERLSTEVLVRIDGKITFPLLNDIQAAGRTPMMLKTEIENGLKLYVENPIVTVAVAFPDSKKFYVLGEVTRTNEYPLVKQTTILQAFAIAGGFTEWASKKEILLIRKENGEDKIIRINYKDIIKGKHPENNIFIQANDTIVIP